MYMYIYIYIWLEIRVNVERAPLSRRCAAYACVWVAAMHGDARCAGRSRSYSRVRAVSPLSLSRARPPCIYARFDSGKRQRATRTRRKIISDLPRLRRVAVVYAAPPDPSRILENGNSSSYGVIACRARFPSFLFFKRNNKPSLSSFSKNETFRSGSMDLIISMKDRWRKKRVLCRQFPGKGNF